MENHMNLAIENMLSVYQCKTLDDYINALKEIIQKIALLGLWRAKFFDKAAFYGGTALRILYGLNRFSEDMDFSLLKKESTFSLKKYNEAIETELRSFGLEVSISVKEKKIITNIESSLIKAEVKQQLITVLAPKELITLAHKDRKIKIKMEVDTDPPLNFETEQKIVLTPIPFSVGTFKKPDLFATKVHAVLCRTWNLRVKGRDWYDLVWYVGQNTPIRISHLQTRLERSGHWPLHKALDLQSVKKLLSEKIETLDIEQAKKDVLPFLADPDSVKIWSQDFFQTVVSEMTAS